VVFSKSQAFSCHLFNLYEEEFSGLMHFLIHIDKKWGGGEKLLKEPKTWMGHSGMGKQLSQILNKQGLVGHKDNSGLWIIL
jgi:hypothetical protein